MRTERLAAESASNNISLAPKSWRQAAQDLVEEKTFTQGKNVSVTHTNT